MARLREDPIEKRDEKGRVRLGVGLDQRYLDYKIGMALTSLPEQFSSHQQN